MWRCQLGIQQRADHCCRLRKSWSVQASLFLPFCLMQLAKSILESSFLTTSTIFFLIVQAFSREDILESVREVVPSVPSARTAKLSCSLVTTSCRVCIIHESYFKGLHFVILWRRAECTSACQTSFFYMYVWYRDEEWCLLFTSILFEHDYLVSERVKRFALDGDVGSGGLYSDKLQVVRVDGGRIVKRQVTVAQEINRSKKWLFIWHTASAQVNFRCRSSSASALFTKAITSAAKTDSPKVRVCIPVATQRVIVIIIILHICSK